MRGRRWRRWGLTVSARRTPTADRSGLSMHGRDEDSENGDSAARSVRESSRISNKSRRQGADGGYQTGRWTREEHLKFLEGLNLHGREWKRVAECIRTRTSAQVRVEQTRRRAHGLLRLARGTLAPSAPARRVQI